MALRGRPDDDLGHDGDGAGRRGRVDGCDLARRFRCFGLDLCGGDDLGRRLRRLCSRPHRGFRFRYIGRRGRHGPRNLRCLRGGIFGNRFLSGWCLGNRFLGQRLPWRQIPTNGPGISRSMPADLGTPPLLGASAPGRGSNAVPGRSAAEAHLQSEGRGEAGWHLDDGAATRMPRSAKSSP